MIYESLFQANHLKAYCHTNPLGVIISDKRKFRESESADDRGNEKAVFSFVVSSLSLWSLFVFFIQKKPKEKKQ